MYLRLSSALAAAAAGLGAGCAMAPPPPHHQVAEAQSPPELATALAGRAAGAPVSCISDKARMHVVNDWTIIYRDRGTVYVQRPVGGCHGLSNNMSLIRNQFVSTRLCRGDINRVVDLRTGFGTGACVFSEFVPYRRIG